MDARSVSLLANVVRFLQAQTKHIVHVTNQQMIYWVTACALRFVGNIHYFFQQGHIWSCCAVVANCVQIPMEGKNESFNVSVAAGLAMYGIKNLSR